MTEATLNKLKILAESAKYDVSCSSSGTVRRGKTDGIGNTVGGVGICHSFADDGRCVSLLKVMLTNYCKYDCAYCINRVSNDIPRATLSVTELVEITMEFYRRNYIEGLFLSSGVVRNPDYTMERLVKVAEELRTTHRFNGYIHLKSIPGASRELVARAGLYADRMSVNIEIPNETSLKYLAPDKNFKSVYEPMGYIRQGVLENKEDRRKFKHVPCFVPAGQSTQMIVGATPEHDSDILRMSSALYATPTMRRVYYSGYIHVNTYDSRLPALKQPALVRENRLYQADWLMRFYNFTADEIANDTHPDLELEIDPKLSWALRHPECFPIDVNRADYEMILRIPGVGVKSATLIVNARRFRRLTSEHLKKMGVVMKRAKYFITCGELSSACVADVSPEYVRRQLTEAPQKRLKDKDLQLTLDFGS
jgi:putative DNA modification/repair radical SAM protein